VRGVVSLGEEEQFHQELKMRIRSEVPFPCKWQRVDKVVLFVVTSRSRIDREIERQRRTMDWRGNPAPFQ